MKLWWRRGASLLVLLVLAVAPAVAAACAELCQPLASAASSAHHDVAGGDHEAMSDCHGAEAGPVTDVLTSAPCDHHDDGRMGTAIVTAGRDDTRILLAQAPTFTATLGTGAAAVLAIRGPSSQPTPPRPTAAPLALRI